MKHHNPTRKENEMLMLLMTLLAVAVVLSIEVFAR